MASPELQIQRLMEPEQSLKRLNRAREVAERRASIWGEATSFFLVHADEIAKVNTRFHKEQPDLLGEGEGLPPGNTRELNKRLWSSLSSLKQLWPHLPDSEEELENSDYFRVRAAVLNRYRVDNGNVVVPWMRSGIKTEPPVPYGVHSHVDLPLFLSMYSPGATKFTYALANAHDVVEEGIDLKKGVPSRIVDLSKFVKFAEDNLGTRLAIAVPLLTESPYETLLEFCDKNLIDNYFQNQALLDAMDEFRRRFPQYVNNKDPANLIARPPLVFGSLANQIVLGVQVLQELARTNPGTVTETQLKDVAASLIEVEIADRQSDIATLQRFVINHASNPEYGKFRTILYSARLLNMFECLSKVGDRTSRTESIASQLGGYLGDLEYKIMKINELLAEAGATPITGEEILGYYQGVYKPIQLAANKATDSFIQQKTRGIISGLTMSP